MPPRSMSEEFCGADNSHSYSHAICGSIHIHVCEIEDASYDESAKSLEVQLRTARCEMRYPSVEPGFEKRRLMCNLVIRDPTNGSLGVGNKMKYRGSKRIGEGRRRGNIPRKVCRLNNLHREMFVTGILISSYNALFLQSSGISTSTTALISEVHQCLIIAVTPLNLTFVVSVDDD